MEIVEVYRAADQQQAHVLKNLLAEDGVRAFVSGENLAGMTDMTGWTVMPKVMVAATDLKQARLIVSDYDERLRSSPQPASIDELENEYAEEDEYVDSRLDSWPSCSSCSTPKHTTCPSCEKTGVGFDLAEFVAASETESENSEIEILPEQLKLLCPVCETIFVPQFFSSCDCKLLGVDAGQELNRPSVAPAQSPVNGRILTVVLGILAVIAAAIYFIVLIT